MTPLSTSPLVFVELLTDRRHRLGGLHWRIGSGDAGALLAWLRSAELAQLAADIPCAWDPEAVGRWPESLQEALSALTARATVEPATALVPRHDNALPLVWPDTPLLAGQWYIHPPAKPSAAQAASRAMALHLLRLVSQDADTHELEEVFRHDATLSYQLLRLVNSLALGGRRTITSFGQAILMMGRQPLKRWLNLLLFAARSDDPRSALLMAHVTLRARGMELLANAAGLDRALQDLAFMTGMFSMLDVLFGQALADIVLPLHLSEDLLAALLERKGDLGQLLSTWQAVERADETFASTALADWQIPHATFNLLQVQACRWMLSLTHEGGDT